MNRLNLMRVQRTSSRENSVRRQSTGPQSNGHPIASLQKAIGNQALQRLINSPYIQAKLQVSSPGDPYEQEADRVADTVMRMPDSADVVAQRPTEKNEEEEKLLQTRSVGPVAGSFEAGADVESRLNRRGGGSPLPDSVRTYMEPRFGMDFGHVNVHTGSDAIELNQDVGAKAFTHGSDIYYGAGQSPNNLDLTAHELTHVVQQTGRVPLHTTHQTESVTFGTKHSMQRACTECEKEDEKEPNLNVFAIQRTIGDGHDFPPASRFAGNAILEAVFDNERVLLNGSTGAPVTLVQQTLIALGYPLPRFGADGIFGDETRRAVDAFQRDVGLVPDGVVGFRTIDFLDKRDRNAEIAPPVRPVLANAPFNNANAKVQPGAAPSIPLGPGDWGLTFPENVQVGIDVFNNGGVWQPVLTEVTGNYSMQTRLLPGVNEVTGPAGNTTAANYCAQITDLNNLTHFQGAWFMLSAVLSHERVHARQFRTALIDPSVIGPLEAAIEAITTPVTFLTPTPLFGEIFIRFDAAFAAALNAAQANWLAQILVLVAADHAPGGTADTQEHEIVDPMIIQICRHARANGWAACPPLCP
jgi:peptidoglycan hydrolase-like protein with peptidoglycan-binding domain